MNDSVTVKVVVGLIVAFAGAVLGWALGRFTKVIEFRFEIFMRAIDAYTATHQAANGLLDRLAALEDVTPALTQLDDRVHDMMSLTPVIELVFGGGGGHWLRIIHALNTIDEHDKVAAAKTIVEAHDEWWTFTKVAERKCLLNPWRRWRGNVFDVVTAGKWRDGSDAPAKGGSAQ